MLPPSGLKGFELRNNIAAEWRQVAFISSSMLERRYTQSKKEMLALTWACELYQSYLIGMDHDHIQY